MLGNVAFWLICLMGKAIAKCNYTLYKNSLGEDVRVDFVEDGGEFVPETGYVITDIDYIHYDFIDSEGDPETIDLRDGETRSSEMTIAVDEIPASSRALWGLQATGGTINRGPTMLIENNFIGGARVRVLWLSDAGASIGTTAKINMVLGQFYKLKAVVSDTQLSLFVDDVEYSAGALNAGASTVIREFMADSASNYRPIVGKWQYLDSSINGYVNLDTRIKTLNDKDRYKFISSTGKAFTHIDLGVGSVYPYWTNKANITGVSDTIVLLANSNGVGIGTDPLYSFFWKTRDIFIGSGVTDTTWFNNSQNGQTSYTFTRTDFETHNPDGTLRGAPLVLPNAQFPNWNNPDVSDPLVNATYAIETQGATVIMWQLQRNGNSLGFLMQEIADLFEDFVDYAGANNVTVIGMDGLPDPENPGFSDRAEEYSILIKEIASTRPWVHIVSINNILRISPTNNMGDPAMFANQLHTGNDGDDAELQGRNGIKGVVETINDLSNSISYLVSDNPCPDNPLVMQGNIAAMHKSDFIIHNP
jgi:hypothetical protein